MAEIARDYLLLTFYQTSADRTPIMHAYGPYTKAEAIRERRQMKADTLVRRGAVLHVKVRKGPLNVPSRSS